MILNIVLLSLFSLIFFEWRRRRRKNSANRRNNYRQPNSAQVIA